MSISNGEPTARNVPPIKVIQVMSVEKPARKRNDASAVGCISARTANGKKPESAAENAQLAGTAREGVRNAKRDGNISAGAIDGERPRRNVRVESKDNQAS